MNVQELIDLLSDMNPESQVSYDTLYGLELVSWVDVEHSDEFGDTVVLGS